MSVISVVFHDADFWSCVSIHDMDFGKFYFLKNFFENFDFFEIF